MTLIRTNDGLIGIKTDKGFVWFSTQEEALSYMWGVFARRAQFTKEEVAKDLAYAIDYCRSSGDDIIEFGCLGSFMYTTKSPDQEESNEL